MQEAGAFPRVIGEKEAMHQGHVSPSRTIDHQPPDAAGNGLSTSEVCSASMQLARKLTFFSSSSKVNPLGTVDEKGKSAPSEGGIASSEAGCSRREIEASAARGRASWNDLPDPIVEYIFLLLKADTVHSRARAPILENELQKDPSLAAYKFAGVCRSWRHAVKRIFLDNWWLSGRLNHPSQCLLLTPRWFPCLLRCFVERSTTGRGTRFTLFQGERSHSEISKFLLSAEITRFGIKLFFSKDNSAPCGDIQSNMFCTKYSCRAAASSFLESGSDPGGRSAAKKTAFADIDYRTRIHACMRPRRMHVTLPGDNLLRESVPPVTRCQGVRGMVEQSGQAIPNPVAQTPEQINKLNERSAFVLARQGRQLRLENKAPHWNENLKCWCLNFRSRVRLASVKNFQLVNAAEDPHNIVMQFGKVAANTYILDYQPALISAVQAFAVSLSAFNKGFSPC